MIQQAEGLAIFTVFRTAPGWTAASGSGIVISRDSPTTWGPPSGILIHTVGVNFLAGIDVYDVVLVLRTREAVMAFATPKVRSNLSFSSDCQERDERIVYNLYIYPSTSVT